MKEIPYSPARQSTVEPFWLFCLANDFSVLYFTMDYDSDPRSELNHLPTDKDFKIISSGAAIDKLKNKDWKSST